MTNEDAPMMRTIGLSCVALAALTPGLRADDKADAFKAAVLTMEDGKYTVDFAGGQDKGTVAVDVAKKPKQMTIAGTDGPNKGKTIPAVYELSGDMLKICYQL